MTQRAPVSYPDYLMLDKLHRRLWGARVHREPGYLLKSAVRALRS